MQDMNEPQMMEMYFQKIWGGVPVSHDLYTELLCFCCIWILGDSWILIEDQKKIRHLHVVDGDSTSLKDININLWEKVMNDETDEKTA